MTVWYKHYKLFFLNSKIIKTKTVALLFFSLQGYAYKETGHLYHRLLLFLYKLADRIINSAFLFS
jgi:hypothetical protein